MIDRPVSLREIEAALKAFRLKNRREHPMGRFDRAQRWTPVLKLACCDRIRSPSRSFPSSLLLHQRTACHVATSYGVEGGIVHRLMRILLRNPSAAGSMTDVIRVLQDEGVDLAADVLLAKA